MQIPSNFRGRAANGIKCRNGGKSDRNVGIMYGQKDRVFRLSHVLLPFLQRFQCSNPYDDGRRPQILEQFAVGMIAAPKQGSALQGNAAAAGALAWSRSAIHASMGRPR